MAGGVEYGGVASVVEGASIAGLNGVWHVTVIPTAWTSIMRGSCRDCVDNGCDKQHGPRPEAAHGLICFIDGGHRALWAGARPFI